METHESPCVAPHGAIQPVRNRRKATLVAVAAAVVECGKPENGNPDEAKHEAYSNRGLHILKDTKTPQEREARRADAAGRT